VTGICPDGRSGRDAENQDGDVVGAAVVQGHGHQLLASFRGGIGLYDAGQVRVADQAPESVGAKNKDVTFFQGDGVFRNVRGNIAAGAQGSGKNVTLRVRLGVFRANDAALDQAADVRMIAGETGDGLGANQVKATVANVSEIQSAVDDGESGTGGSHAVELRVFHGITLNILVSGLEGGDQRSLRIAAKGIVVDVAHGLDGEATSFLPAFVTAHAVGDDGETALAEEVLVGVGLPIEIGILVIGALTADVGEARRFDAGLWSFGLNRHR
jgi:hypothetical protein